MASLQVGNLTDVRLISIQPNTHNFTNTNVDGFTIYNQYYRQSNLLLTDRIRILF